MALVVIKAVANKSEHIFAHSLIQSTAFHSQVGTSACASSFQLLILFLNAVIFHVNVKNHHFHKKHCLLVAWHGNYSVFNLLLFRWKWCSFAKGF